MDNSQGTEDDKKKGTNPETLNKRKETIEREGSAKRDAPVGILRVDSGPKSRRNQSDPKLLQGEPSSPQPSVDRLSVTFAEDSVRSDSSTRINLYTPRSNNTSPNMEKVHFPGATDAEDSDEEDYSASVNAIIQRRASERRSKKRSSRRASSPFSPDILPGTESGRRASVFTTSSGDTAITVDDSLAPELTQEQIFENIRLHKEVLSNVKMQPWNMRKKLKLVTQAKSYVKRHEGALQERFTHSHSIKNMLARWNIYLIKKLHYTRREMANLSNWLIPWEKRIKAIESHFGSVVASYFIFLRWLFWVNVVTTAILMAFVAVPEIITTSASSDAGRKQVLPEDKYNATNFVTLWDFEGVLKYTPLFYGWYTNKDFKSGYRLPLAYFMTQLIVYVYSFVATLRKMAENSRMSKLSEKDDQCTFTWKMFTGWDYMIGNPETAHNRVMSVVMSFKEALLEEAEMKRKDRNWKIIWTRVFVNLIVLGLFALSAAAVVVVVKRSTEPEANSNAWRRNETTVVMTLISFVVPMLLEFMGFMEHYHPRKQLRIQLARIMLLNLLNLYSLIFAQFDKISDMTEDLRAFKPNVTPIPVDPIVTNLNEPETFVTTTLMQLSPFELNLTRCSRVCYNLTETQDFTVTDMIASIAATVATTVFPKLLSSLNNASSMFNATGTSFINNFTLITQDNYTIDDNTTTFDYNRTLILNERSVNLTETLEADYDELAVNLEDKFQDYLSHILGTVYIFNVSYQSPNESEEFFNSTPYLNETNLNLTAILQNASTYEYFKTTLAPFFNTTADDIDERFETELSKLYDEVTGTIISTQTEPWRKCEDVCETLAPPWMPTKTYPSTTPYPTPDILDTSVLGTYQNRTKLRSLCWETMFGQELVKLTVMDFVFTVAGIIGFDFVRGIFVRVMNRCWCWDLEKKFPEYGEFKVAENILHLVNNQGMVWMGMFFSPGVVLINVFKLMLLMYLRSWAVLTCNVPHEVIFRASRSNNFYFALLLTMLFLCVLPVGYAIVWVEPSWHCGPFSNYYRIFHILTRTIRKLVPKTLHKSLDYIVSPGIVIPLLVLLILIIYYLISLTNSLREANADLKVQLRQERTEERRKMFQIAARRRRVGSSGSGDLDNTPFGKWKQLLSTLPATGKSMDDTSKATTPSAPPAPAAVQQNGSAKPETNKTRDMVSKFIKRALRRSSITSEDESVQVQDDATDTEQPDSLPDDVVSLKEAKGQVKPFSLKAKNVLSGTSKNKLENVQRGSVDSNEGKRVQIAPTTPEEIYRKQQRRDTFDLKKKDDWKQKQRNHSPTRSSSSKDTRHDSITSNWSDNIPVITISKTESAENILEQCTEVANGEEQNGEEKVSNGFDEPRASSSTDTLVAEEEPLKPRVKHVLKKQTEVTENDENSDTVNEESEEESTKTTIKSRVFEKSSTSGTSDTKTESSTDYKDRSLS